jgi:hypothetical protein
MMRHSVTRSDHSLSRLARPRRILLTTALALALAGTLATTVTSTHVAAATASPAANYCNYNVSTQSGRCFYSEQELLDHNATSNSLTYITVYNWINYNPDGGYKTIGGNSACTVPFDDEGKNISSLVPLKYTMPNGSVGTTLNDTITSVDSNDGTHCNVKLFEHVNYTGRSTGWIRDNRDLRGIGFNDLASSLRIS